jgi:hypothetical protein
MTASANAIDLLHREISNPDTQWSLGTFGAIAEFSRDHDEPALLSDSPIAISAVTARGGIALKPRQRSRPLASESITKTGWAQRVALCLPAGACAMNRRAALTELDIDHEALRPQDRGSVLFDLGLSALQADFCIRVDDRETIARLRRHVGRSLFEAGNPAMALILEANPHRVFISRLGRIEVYQPIPPASGSSPDGPHTHILPKLLKSGRTHPATEPIPDGWIPCVHLYPPHPARNGSGESRAFDTARHDSFQLTIEAFGDPECLAIKRRIIDAVNAGEPPSAMAQTRHGRSSIRIALRQMKAAGHPSPALPAWLANFDQAEPEADEEGTSLHHDC